jgi:NCAIR mutase (PurE)-related protein
MQKILFDHGRSGRIGLPESVFCQGKSEGALCELLRRFRTGSGHAVLFTRLEKEVFRHLPPDARDGVDYHPLSRTALGDTLPPYPGKNPQASVPPSVAVVAAGTADGFVTWEAARTLQYLGIRHTVYEDLGVAGLWRLTERLDDINSHDALIIVAGLDAALASVLGGLTPKPAFAVPTSVGYGMADGGRAALAGMLVSCAPGVAVLNIDNGYGAACAAARVIHLL